VSEHSPLIKDRIGDFSVKQLKTHNNMARKLPTLVVESVNAISGTGIQPPKLETEGLITIVLSLLGLDSLRTYEKLKGVQKNH